MVKITVDQRKRKNVPRTGELTRIESERSEIDIKGVFQSENKKRYCNPDARP